jgi:hypothetical protein
VAHFTVSMPPPPLQFYDLYMWPLRNTAWPPGGGGGHMAPVENHWSRRSTISELVLNGNRPESLIRQCRRRRQEKEEDLQRCSVAPASHYRWRVTVQLFLPAAWVAVDKWTRRAGWSEGLAWQVAFLFLLLVHRSRNARELNPLRKKKNLNSSKLSSAAVKTTKIIFPNYAVDINSENHITTAPVSSHRFWPT